MIKTAVRLIIMTALVLAGITAIAQTNVQQWAESLIQPLEGSLGM